MWHHTHAGPGRPTVQATAEYHAGPSPMMPPGIAYTIYIDGEAVAYLCHDLEACPWSQGTGSPYSRAGTGIFNVWGLSVCFSGDTPTEAQLAKGREVAEYVEMLLGRPIERRGHREVSVENGRPLTECPGSEFSRWKGKVE